MYCAFVLRAVRETNIFETFSTFTARPVSLQWTNEAYGVYALSNLVWIPN
jgi:hypothetical protein